MEILTFEHLSIAPRLVIVAFSVVVRLSSRIRLPSTVQQSERASQWRSVILSMSGTCYSRVATRQIHSREIVEVFKMWVKHSEQYDPRTIALQREASLADGLLTLGFKSLQIADFQNQECYYAGFFNMTIALERVCKLAIQSDSYKREGQFLTDGELKKYGISSANYM